MLVSRPIARRLGVLAVRIADVIEEKIVGGQLGDFRRGDADDGGVGGHFAGEIVEPRAFARLVCG